MTGGFREVIDEFPSLLSLGDLHPHVLAIPLACLLSAALNFFLALA